MNPKTAAERIEDLKLLGLKAVKSMGKRDEYIVECPKCGCVLVESSGFKFIPPPDEKHAKMFPSKMTFATMRKAFGAWDYDRPQHGHTIWMFCRIHALTCDGVRRADPKTVESMAEERRANALSSIERALRACYPSDVPLVLHELAYAIERLADGQGPSLQVLPELASSIHAAAMQVNDQLPSDEASIMGEVARIKKKVEDDALNTQKSKEFAKATSEAFNVLAEQIVTRAPR